MITVVSGTPFAPLGTTHSLITYPVVVYNRTRNPPGAGALRSACTSIVNRPSIGVVMLKMSCVVTSA